MHYPLDNGKITTTDVARRSGKPLWASEDQPNSGAGPIQQRTWPLGGRILAHLYNRNYLEGSMTKTESVLHPAGEQKRAQIDQMIRFAESNQCRMMSLVRHFGDTSDGATACGLCDFCAPAKCVAQRFRNSTEEERVALYRVLNVMRSSRSKSTGKLYSELYPGNEISRDNFEEILGAMARAGLLCFADAVFEKQGKLIPYRTVCLTPAGRATHQTTPVLFVMKDARLHVSKGKQRKKSRKSTAPQSATARKPSGNLRTGAESPSSEQQIRLEQALRAWRLSEAKRKRVPAFRIFGDCALLSIAMTSPRNEEELLAVPGIGIGIVKKYGTQIFRLIAGPR